MDFFKNWFHFLDHFTEWLDNFTHFLDDWFVDLMRETMGLFLGSGGFVLSGSSWSVDLLDENWARDRSEDEMYGLFIGLDFDELRDWCLIWKS
jgi:hypothetical protein